MAEAYPRFLQTSKLKSLIIFAKRLMFLDASSSQLFEAASGGVFQKKLFLKISQYSQESTCIGVSFFSKRLQHRCFLVNIVKFLRIPILKNNHERLLLYGLLHFSDFQYSILQYLCGMG